MGSSSTPHAAAGRLLYLLLGKNSNNTHRLLSSSSRYNRYQNPRRVMSTSSSKESIQFQFSSKIHIPPSHVFYETPLSFAFVNIKPVVPGHVLVVPKRIVEKFEEMTTEEITDVMSTSQRVSKGSCFSCSLTCFSAYASAEFVLLSKEKPFWYARLTFTFSLLFLSLSRKLHEQR
jgi:hypothetical protein